MRNFFFSFFLLTLSCFLLFSIAGCKKDNSPASNNPPTTTTTPTSSTDTTGTSNKITLNLTKMQGGVSMYVGTKFKYNLNIIWGDGLINNYLLPSALPVSGSDASVRILSHSNWGGNGNSGNYTSIFSAKDLTYFSCNIGSSWDTSMSYADFSSCPSIKEIYLDNVKSINVSNCFNLETLKCWSLSAKNGRLTKIDLQTDTSLKTLILINNRISSLDVSNNKNLTTLVCTKDTLFTLVLNNHRNIDSLNCSFNNLTSLSILSNAAYRKIDCRNNNLSAAALNKIFDSLPVNSTPTAPYRIYIQNNPGTFSCNTVIANQKGWNVFTN
jgi:hypothetical protein